MHSLISSSLGSANLYSQLHILYIKIYLIKYTHKLYNFIAKFHYNGRYSPFLLAGTLPDIKLSMMK